MKFLFTGKEFGLSKRGGFVVTKRFCDWFSDKTEFIEASKITKDHLNKYQKVIFLTQVPTAYNIPVNGIALRNVNHLVYIRSNRITPMLNSCTNGFNYYKRFKLIKNYIPTITPFSVNKNKRDDPCLGFYQRNFITRDSFDWFRNCLSTLKCDVDVYLMGDPPKIDFSSLNHVRNVTHTYNNEEFFSNVTHYIYPRSKTWVDPFPHSILEAIQSNCQIISPTIHQRNHMDGVDDLLSCIEYHDEFDPNTYYDNSKSIILSNFKPFYERVFANDFEYSFDRNKYVTFCEWIEKEVT